MAQKQDWTPEMRKAASERAKEAYAKRMAKEAAQKEEQNPEIKVTTTSTPDGTYNIVSTAPENITLTPSTSSATTFTGDTSSTTASFSGSVPPVEPPLKAVDPNAVASGPVDPGEAHEPEIEQLKRQIEELKAYLFDQSKNVPAGPKIANGRVIGTTDRYVVDPDHYADPRVRLMNEPKLQRFAFKDNYELDFNVSTVSYETKDGLNMREPKFRLELHGIMYDDETGERTNRRYVVGKATFFEDPQTAIVVARENGLEVDEDNEKWFLDEMRYLRMRDWLFEAFYPPKITQSKKDLKETVVGGKIVQYFEASSQDSVSIPYSDLKKMV